MIAVLMVLSLLLLPLDTHKEAVSTRAGKIAQWGECLLSKSGEMHLI